MTWIETIRVSFGSRSWTDLDLMGTLQSQLAAVEALEWAICGNPSVPEDVLVVLRWQGSSRPAGSSVGLALARELKRHGLVDHAVWESVSSLGARSTRDQRESLACNGQ